MCGSVRFFFNTTSRFDAEKHEHLASILDCQAINDFALSLFNDHVQQGFSQMVIDASVSNHFVAEENKTQVVDIFAVVLLDVHAVHVHLKNM